MSQSLPRLKRSDGSIKVSTFTTTSGITKRLAHSSRASAWIRHARCATGVCTRPRVSTTATLRRYAAPALAKAVSLQDGVTDRERLYIRATTADFSQAAELWRNLTRQYPNDLHAQILLALTLQDGVDEQGEPRRGQQEALEILEHVMTADPENSAAHHYYVHALEASAHPDRALRSAEILGRLAPASGHVVHMPGHIFFRLGDYARAERAFAASQRVDERYMQKQHVRPDDDWNYVHNLMYAVANLMERGKLKDAIRLSTKLSFARGRLETTLYIFSARDSISRLNPNLPVALRTANWNEVLDGLKTSSSPPERPNLAFLAAELATFATGMQALVRRDIVMALEQSRKLDTALGQVSGNANSQVVSAGQPGESPTLQVLPDALLQPLLRTISIMASELRGAVLAATGKVSEAKTVYQQAAQAEKALGYREPPNYIRPVFEAEGAALGAAGEWSAARQAYAQALIERPRSGFSLYGLALCSERLGDSVTAADEYATFLDVWKEADKTLPEVAHARAYLAAHRKATIAATRR